MPKKKKKSKKKKASKKKSIKFSKSDFFEGYAVVND